MGQKDYLSSELIKASQLASSQGTTIYFDFLEPSSQLFVEREIARYPECDCDLFGGHTYCESKMLCIYPKGSKPDYSEYPIECIQIELNKKNYEIDHRDVLGALCGAGIQRDKIGDIKVSDKIIQIFIASPLANFIETHMSTIGRYEVEPKKVEFEDIIEFEPTFQEVTLIVPSLRADAVIHSAYKLSRTEASDYIKGEKVRINNVIAKKPSVNIKIGDSISVRTKGKFIVDELTGSTKKGNTKLRIKKYV